MKLKFLVAVLATIVFASAAKAELNTATYVSHDGGGSGAVEGDMTGVGPVTLLDGADGDMWNGGDQFMYLHDNALTTGTFTATVRVVSQTEAIDGRWGKAGIRASGNLTGNSANAMAQVAAGNGSQVDPPAMGDHSPVPVRIAGRTGNDGQGGFEDPVFDASGAEVPNNVFPPGGADPNPAWLRLVYEPGPNSFVAGFAPDVNGSPGEWNYSNARTDVPATGDGWYVGLGYSAHNEMSFDQITRADGFHGVTFDNYSIVPIVPITGSTDVGGNNLDPLELTGSTDEIVVGDPVQTPGLAQYWFDGNMRANPDAFLEAIAAVDAGEPGSAANPLLNPGGQAFASNETWWNGSQGFAGLPDYPANLTGTRFEGSGDENDYGVRLVGEIFIPENGPYVLRDGIDDYTMLAVDQDGDGRVADEDGFDYGDSLNEDLNFGPYNDIAIHDDDWADIDGASQPNNGYPEFTNVAEGGEWRAIEIWMSEGGGGDGAVVFMASPDDPDLWDTSVEDGLSAAQQTQFLIPHESLRSEVPGLSGSTTAGLGTSQEYVMQVSSGLLRSDYITVARPGDDVTTKLDVTNASVRVEADGELIAGDEWVLFAADELIGGDSIIWSFDDPSKWDVTKVSENVAGGYRITYLPENNFGDCNGDGAVDADDLACVSTIDERNAVLATIPSLPGDLDGNGDVAFPDFLVLSANFGQDLPSYTDGNIDLAGAVAFPDFLILSANFGKTPAAGGATAAAVPEPSSLALLGLSGLLLGLVRRRRR